MYMSCLLASTYILNSLPTPNRTLLQAGDFSKRSTRLYEQRWMELFGHDFKLVGGSWCSCECSGACSSEACRCS